MRSLSELIVRQATTYREILFAAIYGAHPLPVTYPRLIEIKPALLILNGHLPHISIFKAAFIENEQ